MWLQNMNQREATAAGFEEGERRSWAKKCWGGMGGGGSLEAEQGKKMDFPLETPERNAALSKS